MFTSFMGLRGAHLDLLKRHRAERDIPEVLAGIEAFVADAAATGATLDAEDDRAEAQTIIDYWTSIASRAPEATVRYITLADFDPALAPTLEESARPYVGLEPFREDTHELFRGRQGLVDEILDRLRSGPLVAVVGASGSGKSSLVLAGVVPALKAGKIEDSARWLYCATFVPGSEPLVNLARAMRPPNADAQWVENLARALARNPTHLRDLVRAGSGRRVMIVVDQFEELFTLCSDTAKRRAFVDNLVALVEDRASRHRVIITMRRDFEERLVRFEQLEPFLREGRVHVTALSAQELREAIERPAERAGLRFENGIIDRIVEEILGEPAGLPLLQFTLLKLWEGRQHNLVTWEVYERLGGCRQALARSADAFYASLRSNQERYTAKLILLRLVRPAEGFEFTSGRVPLSALRSLLNDRQRIDEVVDKLVKARLVRCTQGATDEDSQVEVAHEALIRNWPTLIDWLGEARESLRRRGRLTEAARQWDALGRDPGALWSAVQLADLRGAEITEGLDDLERTFIAASQREIERAEREKKDMEEQKRRLTAWRKRFLVATAVAGILAAIVLGVVVRILMVANENLRLANERTRVAFEERDQKAKELAQSIGQLEVKRLELEAKNEQLAIQTTELEGKNTELEGQKGEIARLQKIAELRQRTAEAQLLKTQQSHLLQSSVLLGIEARRRAGLLRLGTSEYDAVGTSNMMRNSLAMLPSLVGSMPHQGRVTNAFFAPDGQFVATLERTEGDETERIRVWEPDKRTGKWTEHLQWPQRDVRQVFFSPDGKYLVGAGRSATSGVVIWDIATRQRVPSPKIEGEVLAVGFAPDGDKLLVAGRDSIRWWGVSERQYVRSDAYEGGADLCQFAPAGEWFAVARRVTTNESAAGAYEVDLRHTSGSMPARALAHPAPVTAMTFSDDGRYLVTTTRDGIMRVWRTRDGTAASQLADADFATLAFMPRSDYIASATRDGAIKVWAAATGRVVARMRHEGRIQTLAFSRTGAYLATSADDRTARVWEAMTGREIARVGHDSGVTAAVFSPDMDFLVTTGLDRNAHVWKMPIEPPGRAVGSGDVLGLSFDDSGRQLVAATRNGGLLSVDVATGRSKTVSVDATVESFLASPNGQHMVTIDRSGRAFLWNVALGTSEPLKVKDASTSAMSFDRGGSQLAMADANGVQVMNTTSLKVATLSDDGVVRRVALSPDGKYVATGYLDGKVRVLAIDKEAPRKVGSPRKVGGLFHAESIKLLTFDRHGRYVAAGDVGGEIRFLEIETGREIGPLVHGVAVKGFRFSTDGKRLATWTEDRTDRAVRVWDVVTARLVAKLPHDAAVTDVVFANRDRDVMTLSLDGTARKWGVATATEIGRMRLGSGLSAGVFGPEAKHLATVARTGLGPGDGVVHLQAFDPKDLLSEACLRLTRNLTYQEWVEYFPDEEYRKTCDNLPVHPSLIAAGKDLAKNGDVRGAVKLLRRGVQLDPSLRREIDPDREPLKLAVPGELKQKLALARRGQIREAAAAYARAQRADPSIKIDENWMWLCWYGGLWERSGEVMFACDTAVQQLSDSGSHLARGLVLSVQGKPQQGAQDFARAIELSRATGRTSNVDAVEMLRSAMAEGTNPFTKKVLEMMR